MTKLHWQQSPEPSYSKKYLRRDNYIGASLHGHRFGRSPARPLVSPAILRVQRQEGVRRKMALTKEEEEELAIYAQPMSSDDEALNPPTTAAPTPVPESTKTTAPPRPVAAKRTGAPATASTRSKRRKLQDEGDAAPEIQPGAAIHDPLAEWPSSGSQQKRKMQKTYASRKFQKLDPISSADAKKSDGSAFVKYDTLKAPEKPASNTKFKPLSPVRPRRGKTGRLVTDKLALTELPQPDASKDDSSFRVVDLPDFTSQSTSAPTDVASVFDRTSPVRNRKRSLSTSSLSSLDELEALELEQEQKYINPARGDASTTQCPVCRKSVTDSATLYVPDNLHKMDSGEQRTFCRLHQEAEAKELWERQGWPKVDWKSLEQDRIPTKLACLTDIICRRRSSFYLDQLDSQISKARGNRKTLRSYLNEGIVDVAKQGYYGPKGVQVMHVAVMESLSAELKKALKTDAAVRSAGLGAYVSAVLVPELTLRLVMDDMGLKSEKAARDVLEESTQAGVLLFPDDDHVERKDDDV